MRQMYEQIKEKAEKRAKEREGESTKKRIKE
jgi:hypothetical protein